MSDQGSYLQVLRRRIDELDEEVLELVSQRGRLAQGVGASKEYGGRPAYCYRPEREAVAATPANLHGRALLCKVLGSYPRAVPR